MPISDERDRTAGVLMALYGFDRATLEGRVFPGLRMDTAHRLVL
jgi:hypothetical protein